MNKQKFLECAKFYGKITEHLLPQYVILKGQKISNFEDGIVKWMSSLSLLWESDLHSKYFVENGKNVNLFLEKCEWDIWIAFVKWAMVGTNSDII